MKLVSEIFPFYLALNVEKTDIETSTNRLKAKENGNLYESYFFHDR